MCFACTRERGDRASRVIHSPVHPPRPSLSLSLSIDRSPIYCSSQILTVLLSAIHRVCDRGRGGRLSALPRRSFSPQPKFFPPCIFVTLFLAISSYFPLSSSNVSPRLNSILFFFFSRETRRRVLSRLITSSRYIRSLFIDRYVSFIRTDNPITVARFV